MLTLHFSIAVLKKIDQRAKKHQRVMIDVVVSSRARAHTNPFCVSMVVNDTTTSTTNTLKVFLPLS